MIKGKEQNTICWQRIKETCIAYGNPSTMCTSLDWPLSCPSSWASTNSLYLNSTSTKHHTETKTEKDKKEWSQHEYFNFFINFQNQQSKVYLLHGCYLSMHITVNIGLLMFMIKTIIILWKCKWAVEEINKNNKN